MGCSMHQLRGGEAWPYGNHARSAFEAGGLHPQEVSFQRRNRRGLEVCRNLYLSKSNCTLLKDERVALGVPLSRRGERGDIALAIWLKRRSGQARQAPLYLRPSKRLPRPDVA